MIVDKEVQAKLEELGISVDCISPLEISDDESEASASGYFAEMVIESIMNGDLDIEDEDEDEDEDDDDDDDEEEEEE